MKEDEILILSGGRTPFCAWAPGKTGAGAPGGALKALDPFDLGAVAVKAALQRAALKPEAVSEVVFANTYHVGPHACYGGRYVGLRAGIPESVPSPTVNMACGAGLYAVITAARGLTMGGSDVIAVAGADSSSLVPRNVFVPSFRDVSCGLPIAQTADNAAGEKSVSREEQDRWAMRSHERAASARAQGLFKEEIAEAAGVSQDDAIHDPLKPEVFKDAKPFAEGGSVTSANTHAIVDGGSAIIMANAKGAAGKKPLGRYLAGATAAIAPQRMAEASVPALRKAIALAGLKISDIDLWEINETFAAQTLVDVKELGLPEEKVNVNGGALALGHAFAGSGPRLIHTLLLELRRRGLKRGASCISIGGGQGVAVVVEAL